MNAIFFVIKRGNMSNIEIMKLEDVVSVLNGIKLENIVFWIGAGIDCDGCTGLPLGGELTQFILREACGEEGAKNIMKTWKSRKENMGKFLRGGSIIEDLPRLETIIEAVRHYESEQLKHISLIEGLRSFSVRFHHYNLSHHILAKCLYSGANIVTTNYGDFICQAYKDMYGQESIRLENNELYTYSNNKNDAKIYHIHGISEDIFTIGASLSKVKNKLPDSFKRKVREWFENKYIIFLGYGGVDNLDVNPMLLSLREDNVGKVIYVKHSGDDNIAEINTNERRLVTYFDKKIICPCNTREFLNYFFDHEDLNFNDTEKSVDWKKIFFETAGVFDSDMQMACLLVVSYYLGIPYSQIYSGKDWYRRCLRLKNVSDWCKHYYIFLNSVSEDNSFIKKKEGKYLAKKYSSGLMKSDIYAANGKLKQATEEININKVEKNVNEIILNRGIIQWDNLTYVNRMIQFLSTEYLKIVLKSKRNFFLQREKEQIEKCCVILKKIVDEGYDIVLEVNQINTAYRSLAICYAFLENERKLIFKYLDKALFNYADVSSIDGIIGVYIYRTVSNLILYTKNYKLQLLENAITNFEMVKNYVFAIRMKKYYKTIYKLELLIIVYKCIDLIS